MNRRQDDLISRRANFLPGLSIGGAALLLLAVGALAIGSIAIGALAVGKLRIGRVEIDRLDVRKLLLGESEKNSA
jgi:hypothetical protein